MKWLNWEQKILMTIVGSWQNISIHCCSLEFEILLFNLQSTQYTTQFMWKWYDNHLIHFKNVCLATQHRKKSQPCLKKSSQNFEEGVVNYGNSFEFVDNLSDRWMFFPPSFSFSYRLFDVGNSILYRKWPCNTYFF